MRQPERLRRLLTDPERPIQLVVAGKAHPRDEAGKALIAEVVRLAEDPVLGSGLVFLGTTTSSMPPTWSPASDLWLNTPRYRSEANGTSGMKVLVNGGLNLSELDGWWAEAHEPAVGWALGSADGDQPDDAAEADQLHALLENEVVPAFYEREAAGLPRAWLARMRASMTRLTPRFSSNRMVSEYVEGHYLPAAARVRTLAARGGKAAREAASRCRRLSLRRRAGSSSCARVRHMASPDPPIRWHVRGARPRAAPF